MTTLYHTRRVRPESPQSKSLTRGQSGERSETGEGGDAEHGPTPFALRAGSLPTRRDDVRLLAVDLSDVAV